MDKFDLKDEDIVIDSEDEITEQLLDSDLVEDDLEEELITNDSIEDEDDLDEITETYSKEELKEFKNKTFNKVKIINIYRKKKYGAYKLMAHTRCKTCGKEKKVFLSNLVKDPQKYGSCVCSDTNIKSHMDNIMGLYDGSKKLRNNTSGYTGVYFVKKYRGEPYNKWRAYLELDGHRNYLGDFNSKTKAIEARKAAAEKGIAWYKNNENQFMKKSRAGRKKYRKNSNK